MVQAHGTSCVGDGLAYKYIDLSGGKRPWLLTSVKNGLGKTTEIEYTTSTTEMLAAEAAGAGWTKKTLERAAYRQAHHGARWPWSGG